jgi:hypothetical protein
MNTEMHIKVNTFTVRYAYGTLEENMDILETSKRGPYMNMLEKYYIHKNCKLGIQMNPTAAIFN